MRLENIIVALLATVIILALASISPRSSGGMIALPSALTLELSIYIIGLSLFVIVVLLMKQKKYNPY